MIQIRSVVQTVPTPPTNVESYVHKELDVIFVHMSMHLHKLAVNLLY
jgi:hypothetical protein